jgi:RES domain-containing protein
MQYQAKSHHLNPPIPTMRGMFFGGDGNAWTELPPLTPQEMLWPPPSVVRLGRANEAGDPILYAVSHISTLLTEIGAQEGDLIQTAAVKAHQPMQLSLMGELTQIHRAGISPTAGADRVPAIMGLLRASDPAVVSGLLYVDAFAVDVFNDRSDHRLAAMISGLIFRRQQSMDGIVYPSVRRIYSQNIAIRPASFTSKCRIAGCVLAQVRPVYANGFYEVPHVKMACGIDQDQNSIWADSVNNPAEWREWAE